MLSKEIQGSELSKNIVKRPAEHVDFAGFGILDHILDSASMGLAG